MVGRKIERQHLEHREWFQQQTLLHGRIAVSNGWLCQAALRASRHRINLFSRKIEKQHHEHREWMHQTHCNSERIAVPTGWPCQVALRSNGWLCQTALRASRHRINLFSRKIENQHLEHREWIQPNIYAWKDGCFEWMAMPSGASRISS